MATTYTLISSNTLGSDTASVTFSSIPNTYTDLEIRISARGTLNDVIDLVNLTINNDSSALYSWTMVNGDGTAAQSNRTSGKTIADIRYIDGNNGTANTFGTTVIYIPSYTVSQNKPFSAFSAQEQSSTNAQMANLALLYRSTSAITSLNFTPNGANFKTGSSFYLYGIKNS